MKAIQYLLVVALVAAVMTVGSVSVIAESGESDEAPPQTRVYGLYEVEGRAWTHRVVEWKRGEAARVRSVSGMVASTGDGIAIVRYQGSPDAGGGHAVFLDRPSRLEWAADELPVETVTTPGGDFACRRHRVMRDGVQITTWVSVEHHPLIVRQVKLGPDSCTITTLTRFGDSSAETDPYALYKKEGRSWILRTTVTFEGMDDMVSHTKQEVTSVTNDGAIITITTLDADRNPMAGVPPIETRIEFTDSEGPIEPVELKQETIRVEAGEFQCHVTESDGIKLWTSVKYPALVVKAASAITTTELVEFNE